MYKPETTSDVKNKPWLYHKKSSGLIVASLLLPVMASLVGIFSNVIPTEISIYAGVVFGALLGLFWLGIIFNGYRAGCYRNSKMKFHKRPVLFAASAFLMSLMFGYATVAWTAPWLVNMVVGKHSSQDVTVIGWRSGGARSCSGPDIGTKPLVLAPRALCLPSPMRNQWPVGTHLRIVGPATILGINADSVSIIHEH